MLEFLFLGTQLFSIVFVPYVLEFSLYRLSTAISVLGCLFLASNAREISFLELTCARILVFGDSFFLALFLSRTC